MAANGHWLAIGAFWRRNRWVAIDAGGRIVGRGETPPAELVKVRQLRGELKAAGQPVSDDRAGWLFDALSAVAALDDDFPPLPVRRPR